MRDETEHSRIEHELVRQDRGTDPFAGAVRATRMPMLITDPNQADNPIVFVNAAFSKLTGRPGIPYTLLGQSEIARLGRVTIENGVMMITPRGLATQVAMR